MPVKLRGDTMTFTPGDIIKWGKDLIGTVQPFDMVLAREGFDEGTILYNDRAVSENNWEYILVSFTKELNLHLENDWTPFVPIHQIKSLQSSYTNP